MNKVDLDLAIQIPFSAWTDIIPNVEAACRLAATAAFDAGRANADLPPGPVEACVVLADDAMVRSLNRGYRGRDEATNVLTFVNLDGTPDDVFVLGDIIIAYQTAYAEAHRGGQGIDNHLCHLIVHGMLHLLGYDHENDAEAGRMEALEIHVLSGFGVADPFADNACT